MKTLTDEKIWQAWENAFEKPVDFDHQPTVDEILLLRIKAVIKAYEEAQD